jgi:NAD(P)-dependent dehydrogenase (short-subunit alcohol dehydrogenase family)
MASHAPLNYIADPDDMARAALFLLSDEARWTTGCILPCEGGMSVG